MGKKYLFLYIQTDFANSLGEQHRSNIDLIYRFSKHMKQNCTEEKSQINHKISHKEIKFLLQYSFPMVIYQ